MAEPIAQLFDDPVYLEISVRLLVALLAGGLIGLEGVKEFRVVPAG